MRGFKLDLLLLLQGPLELQVMIIILSLFDLWDLAAIVALVKHF